MTCYPADAFSSSRGAFEALIALLGTPQTQQLDAAGVETLLMEHGPELMRRLLQDHLDLRTVHEEKTIVPMAAADTVLRTESRETQRALETVFGEVTVTRKTLTRRGHPGGLRPLDAHLNLPNGRYSAPLTRLLAWEVAQSAYTPALETLHRTTAAHIPRRQAQRLVQHTTIDFEDFYLQRTGPPVEDDRILVLTTDASGIVMRPEALREETRKRAATQRRRSTAETAASNGQRSPTKNRKRMAQVASLYDLRPQPRTAQDVIDRLRRPGPHPPRPHAENKRVWASVVRSTADVIDEMFVTAGLRDPAGRRRWVVLVDGSDHQLSQVRQKAANQGVDVVIIVDFIHVLGYLWKAGKALVGPDVAAVEGWVERYSERLLEGRVRGVAGGMRRSATMKGLSGKEREAVDACADYLLKYQRYLAYDQYLADGLPIATGVIEGACRSLVKDRMDITGARWGLDGGEAVLQLRALRNSGDLDEYLTFHQERELQRNHLILFDEGELTELREAA